MELTALELYAMELMVQRMDQLELHAQEKSQLLSHTTTPNQPPDKDIKTLVILPQLTHLLLTHQPQSQLLSFKPNQKVLTKKLLLKLEKTLTTRATHNQKKYLFLTQKLLELILLSMPNID
jgi:hypothetical protein